MKFATMNKPSFRPTYGLMRRALVRRRLSSNDFLAVRGRGRTRRYARSTAKRLRSAKRAISQRRLMGGAQTPRAARERLRRLPASAGRTGTSDRRPSTGKADFRHRRRQVVAARFGESEEGVGHHHANRMAANILDGWCCSSRPGKSPSLA